MPDEIVPFLPEEAYHLTERARLMSDAATEGMDEYGLGGLPTPRPATSRRKPTKPALGRIKIRRKSSPRARHRSRMSINRLDQKLRMEKIIMSAHADASPSSGDDLAHVPSKRDPARGKKRLPSPYTREGTAAHEAAERLVHGLPAPAVVTVDGEDIVVSDDMLDHIEHYTKYVEALQKGANWFAAETQVKLTYLPEPLFGTADALAYTIFPHKTLEVVDLKYGRGVAVGVENNPQLKIYGLGGLVESARRASGQAHHRPAPDGWTARPERDAWGGRT